MSDIHTCSYYCGRPACIKVQRDELRDKLQAMQTQAQAGDGFVAQLDRLSNRNYELRMENADLKSKLQGIPVAVRFDWDGEGYQYMDNGSGSDWKTRIPDAELLYTRPQPAQVNQQLLGDIINMMIAAKGAIKIGRDLDATNYISAAITAAQEEQ